MKHKIRDAMRAHVATACHALPGAHQIMAGRCTKGAAYRDVLTAAIEDHYARNRKTVDPMTLAEATTRRDDFASGMELLARTYMALPKASGVIDIAGFQLRVDHGLRLAKGWSCYRASHAEDRMHDDYSDVTPCAERIAEVEDLYAQLLAQRFPELDAPRPRYVPATNGRGGGGIVFRSWNESCDPGDWEWPLRPHVAHGAMTILRQEARRHLDRSADRRDRAAELHARADEMRTRISERIATSAPDMPFNLVEVRINENWGKPRFEITYEGTGFNFRPETIESKTENGVDHYLQHVLPGIINSQRLLRARMDGDDAGNFLVEEPLVRRMQSLYGDAWKNRIAEAMANRKGFWDPENRLKAKVVQGVLRGEFNLAEGVSWRYGVLYLQTRIPDSIVTELKGKPLREVVQHPHFGEAIRIVRIENIEYAGVFCSLRIATNVPSLRIGDMEAPVAAAA